jgi:hypothetical protein
MNSTHYLTLLRAVLLMVPVGSYFNSSTIVHAGDRSALSLGLVRPRQHLEYRAELPQGYLKVYSATDPFDDGGLLYYAHSSYAIYTINGKLSNAWKIIFHPATNFPRWCRFRLALT